jgi:hypothetical protein
MAVHVACVMMMMIQLFVLLPDSGLCWETGAILNVSMSNRTGFWPFIFAVYFAIILLSILQLCM